MKRSIRLLILAAALLLSLVIPQGCATTGNGGESSADNVVPAPQSIPEPDTQRPAPGESEPDPYPEPEAIPVEEDEEFLQQVLLLYGGMMDPDHGRMRTEVASLFYAEAWTSPEELYPGGYFTWFLTTVWDEDLTDEELEERYQSPNRDGWFFPRDIYEARIQEYFDVSVEYLRSDEFLYHPEDEAYWLGGGGGVGIRPFIELRGAVLEGNLLQLTVELDYDQEYMENETWLLSVRLEENGGGWKYESWVSLD